MREIDKLQQMRSALLECDEMPMLQFGQCSSFPAVFPKYGKTRETFESQLQHIADELAEVYIAESEYERIVEVWDVIHACETYLRMVDDATRHEGKETGIVYQAYLEVIAKNERRGYYK